MEPIANPPSAIAPQAIIRRRVTVGAISSVPRLIPIGIRFTGSPSVVGGLLISLEARIIHLDALSVLRGFDVVGSVFFNRAGTQKCLRLIALFTRGGPSLDFPFG